jgi:hypothetical protein
MSRLAGSLVWMVCVAGSVLGSEPWGIERYVPIVMRRPFTGVPPEVLPGNALDKVVTVVKPPSFVLGLRPCSFVETDRGLRVGFVDNRAKPAAVYTLFVGEEREGVFLVDADFEGEAALLRKGGEQYWLAADIAGAAAKATATTPPPVREAKPMTLSFSERRRLRLEVLRQRAAERRRQELAREEEFSVAELERRLQAYQMDLIRQGKTPLPMIPLTPAMDEQLVSEGVLPPQDADGGDAE